MSRPYRPSNGSEGCGFECEWCEKCERDREWREHERDGCAVHRAAYVYDIGEEGYPAQWVCDDDGRNPRCAAFVPTGEDVPAEPGDGQLSLLGEA